MKRLTLNETWKLCLQMWKWIAGQARAGRTDVWPMKEQWLEEHGFDFDDESINNACFFCEYHRQHPIKAEDCNCPAIKIDKAFSCMGGAYDFKRHPIAFYNKLVSLNRKRLKKKKCTS